MQPDNQIQKPIQGIRSLVFFLYTVGFLFSLKVAIPSYINSSFLTSISSENTLSIIYAIAGLFSLIGLYFTPTLLRKIGNRNTIIVMTGFNVLALFGLAFLHNVFGLIFLFIISYVSSYVIGLCLDIFIEYHSRNEETGRIRSSYLTASNLAWIISPFLAGLIIGVSDYWKVYVISALVMLPTLIIIMYGMQYFTDPEYHNFSVISTLRQVARNKDIFCITAADFLLQFFYAMMAIYMPIYLYQNIGLSWFQILVIVFTVLNIPFILIEKPLGWLADKKWGEKEALITGFVILSLSTAYISFVTTKSVVVWSIVMFITRIGAAAVEVMCETYFFKKITSIDSDVISVFRMVSPLSYLVASVATFIFLLFFPLQYIFVALALVTSIGIGFGSAITDTL